MRTAMYREIVARDAHGNEIALYDDAQAVRDDLGLSISTIYRALREGSLINKKSIYLDAKVIIEKTEDFVSMNEQLPNYAKRFAFAISSETSRDTVKNGKTLHSIASITRVFSSKGTL